MQFIVLVHADVHVLVPLIDVILIVVQTPDQPKPTCMISQNRMIHCMISQNRKRVPTHSHRGPTGNSLKVQVETAFTWRSDRFCAEPTEPALDSHRPREF